VVASPEAWFQAGVPRRFARSDIRLAALMLDGIELKGRYCVGALAVTTNRTKVPLGLWDRSTENKTVVLRSIAHRERRAGRRKGGREVGRQDRRRDLQAGDDIGGATPLMLDSARSARPLRRART
jgi:hypothetical protein